jgi:NAD(P)-dependent dehydrogenase (short-subunit alcohol dehydrogenase family)
MFYICSFTGMPITTTIITGATSGIGEETALALAKKDHALYLLVRNIHKGEQLKERLIAETKNQHIFIIQCDLADMQSIRTAADELKAKLFAVNVLINNAGGIFNNRELTKDGFEMTFATNHLGHFLLTTSLMPLLEKGHARIINLSSDAHKAGKPQFENLQGEQGYSSIRAYGMAKLFNIYFAKSLAERYADKGITAFSLHPGIVNTGFGTGTSGLVKFMLWLIRPFMIDAKKGAETSVYLATAPKLDKLTGQYFVKKKVAKPTANANDVEARNKLWAISEELISANVDGK